MNETNLSLSHPRNYRINKIYNCNKKDNKRYFLYILQMKLTQMTTFSVMCKQMNTISRLKKKTYRELNIKILFLHFHLYYKKKNK